MKTPGTAPAIEYEIIPIAEIPDALREAAIISSKKTAHAPRKRSKQTPAAEKKVKVLVVDDDSAIANSTARVLDLFGYECYAVYNPVDAIAAAESFRPDVVISDVIMKGMNGVELCREIRHILPQCRILLISGQVPTAHSLMQDSSRRGYNFELVAKPVRPEELVAKIGTLFGGAYAPTNINANPR